MTVRKQILILLIAFSVIPTMALTTVWLTMNIKGIENLHVDRLSAITKTSAAAFNEIVGLRKDEVSLLVSNWNIRDYINLKERGGDAYETRELLSAINNYFKVYIDSVGTFDDLVLLDENGRVVLGYHPETVDMDLSGTDYFNRLKGSKEGNYVFSSKVHNALFQPDNIDAKCLALGTAFYGADGRMLGALVAYVNVNILAGFSKSIAFGETGLAFVIDSENYILYHPEPRFYNSYTSAPQLANLWDRWKAKQAPDMGLIDDVMDGKRRIYYYEVMPKIELILILRQDYTEFVADRNYAVWSAVISGLVTIALAVSFSILFSKKIMAPIVKLKDAFASSGVDGSYVLVDLPIKNELGDMARSYNGMIKKLERQYAQIKSEKDKNEYNALHDGVTGLANRVAFEKKLAPFVEQSSTFGLLYVDIDSFKQINYLLGHIVGDELLHAIGQRIEQSFGDFASCARISGDEFIMAKNGGVAEMRKAAAILIEELRKPFVIGESTFFITLSIGIAMFPEHGLSMDNLIANADIAMFKAKEKGKNMFSVYNNEMRGDLDRRNNIIEVLRNCIEDDEVFFMYQPVFDAAKNKILGFEALMRINSAKLGLISPLEFVPVAENDKTMMTRLGDLALHKACSFIRRLIDEKGFDGFVSLNLSSVQLNQDNFVENVLGVLAKVGIPAKCLQLEITETIMTGSDNAGHIKKLSAVRAAGVLIALDDFGARNSSFYHFIHLPIDVLKVDRTFFRGSDSNERVELMNKTIIDLANNFGLGIVAECVESHNDSEILKRLGCDVIQGFAYSKPLMEDRVLQIL